MDYVAQKLYNMGYEVYRELEDIKENSVIVLPPPVGDNALEEILPKLCLGQLIYGGAVSKTFLNECEMKNIRVVDYLKIENVTWENAKLTAKGIIKTAEGYGGIKKESKCLITGYGYCGKALARELKNYTPNVTVMVRRKELKSQIEEDGFSFIHMEKRALELSEFDYIFNTVPSMVLDKNRLEEIKAGCAILDIASAPGGTDFSYCKEKNISAGLFLGIPGKMYPKEAGEIIADAIIYDLNSI